MPIDQNFLFPVVPNWSSPVKQTISFKTDIFTTRAGVEFRRAARLKPRQRYEFTGLMRRGGHEDALRRAMARGHEPLAFIMPPYRAEMDGYWGSYTGASPQVIEHRGFYAYSDIIPYFTADIDPYVVQSLPEGLVLNRASSYAGGTINLEDDLVAGSTAELQEKYPLGSYIYRAAMTPFYDLSRMQQMTRESTIVDVAYEIIADDENDYDNYIPASDDYQNGSAAQLHNLIEVFTAEPNWKTPLAKGISPMTARSDFGFGRVQLDTYYDHIPLTQELTFLQRDWDSAMELIGFFMRMRGRQGEFFIPSRMNDMRLSADVADGGTQIIVENSDWADFDLSNVHRHICWRDASGALHTAQVDDMIASSRTTFDLSAGVTGGISKADTPYIDWLYPARLATDELTVEWITEEYAQLVLPIRVIPDRSWTPPE